MMSNSDASGFVLITGSDELLPLMWSGKQVHCDRRAEAKAPLRVRSSFPTRERCPASRNPSADAALQGDMIALRLLVLMARISSERSLPAAECLPCDSAAAEDQGDDVKPVEKIFAESSFLHRLTQIDIRCGDHAHVHLDLLTPPRCMNLLSCSTRRIFACVSMPMVPISSRKIVPPVGNFEQAFLHAIAEVNAPFTCPNSVDSSKSAASSRYSPAQTAVVARRIGVDGFCDQFLAGTALALYQNGGTAGATCWIRSKLRSMMSLLPTMFSKL